MASDFTIEEISNLFHLTDQDKSGTLTRDEILLIMIQLKGGIHPNDEEINTCFQLMDKNGDGMITEEEFLFSMITWLNIVNQNKKTKKRGLDFDDKTVISSSSSSCEPIFNKRKVITDLTNFFLQFAPIDNFIGQQMKILQRKRKDVDMTAVHREYPIYSTEEKAIAYQTIQGILSEGRENLFHELYSLDWGVVLKGVMKMKTLLSIVEIFATAEEKFDISSSIYQIFDGVTQIDPRQNSCFIQRICQLLSPQVPFEMQPTLYSLCLSCLRNYLTGPGLPPPLYIQFDETNIWNQGTVFTHYFLEKEGLPNRLLSILHQYYLDPNESILSTIQSFSSSSISVELLVELIHCLTAFCEENVGCLEGMLHLGIRRQLVQVLSNEQLFHLSILRSGLGCLAVLCGYTHQFESQHEPDSSKEPDSIRNIPPSLQLNDRELCDIIVLISTLIKKFQIASPSSISGSAYDPITTMNFGLVCRYLLPLCSPSDVLYQSILKSLLELFDTNWTFSDSRHIFALISLDSCLLEVMKTSKEICELIWTQTNISLILFNQMEFASNSPSAIPSELSLEICQLCVELYSCLIDYEFYPLFNSHKNYAFHKLCIAMLSQQETSTHHYLLEYLFTCLQSPSQSLANIFLSFDILDEIFSIFTKLKHDSFTLSEILNTSIVRPLYNIQTIRYVAQKLIQFLSINPVQYVTYFHIDHIERIQQLHLTICQELKKNKLKLTLELTQMTDLLLNLLEDIHKAYQLVVNSSAMTEKSWHVNPNQLILECHQLIERWNDDLNRSHQEGVTVSKISSEMHNVSPEYIPPLLPQTRYFTDDIIMIAVPLLGNLNDPSNLSHFRVYGTFRIPFHTPIEHIIKSFSRMCSLDVTLNYLVTGRNELSPIATQEDFDSFRSYLQTNSVFYAAHIAMTLYLTRAVYSPQIVPTHKLNPNSFFGSQNMSNLTSLPQIDQKGVTLKNLQKSLSAQGKEINMELTSLFYDYIHECQAVNGSQSNEITKEQFIQALTSERLGYSPQFAADLFHAFDTNHDQTLSLTEITIGFAKLMNSNYNDKLELIFKAYDRDHNGALDYNELVEMIMVATEMPLEEAKAYATAVGNAVDKNGDNFIQFQEFKDAVFKKLIPLGLAWSDTTSASQRAEPKSNIWKQSGSAISVSNFTTIFQKTNHSRAQSFDFSQQSSANKNNSPLPKGPIRRAYSADWNSVGFGEEGIEMLENNQVDIYVRHRPEENEDDLESKFVNRKHKSSRKTRNTTIPAESSGNTNSLVTFDLPTNTDDSISTTSPLNSQTTFSPYSPGDILDPVREEEEEDLKKEEESNFQHEEERPPTPILSISRKGEQSLPPLQIEILTETNDAPSGIERSQSDGAGESNEKKKRSSRELSKPSPPPPAPSEEKSAIRESKLKDIKKNPFSKSPKS